MNTGRQWSFDFAKFVAIVGMVLVHTFIYVLGEEEMDHGFQYRLNNIYGGVLAAPVFMFPRSLSPPCKGRGKNARLTEENDGLKKRIASIDENVIARLRDKKDAEIKELQERIGKAESEAVRSSNKAYSEHQRAENAEKKLREMLDIPEIKEIWESIQRNKEDFSKQIDIWIEDGVAAIRDYADGKDNDFQPEAGNAVAWGIIAKAFEYGLDPTGEKQHRMAAAYLLESYIDTPSSSLSGSLWWKEVSPC